MPKNIVEILTCNIVTKDIEFIPVFFTKSVYKRDIVIVPLKQKRKNNPEKLRYYRNVWKITLANNIDILMAGNKRGKYDYHIDHKIPIIYGFKNNIPEEQIGHISNLQPLFWKDNFKKSSLYKAN